VNIRSAGPADCDALLEFWSAHAEPTHTNGAADVAHVLENAAADVLVAEDGDAIVGTLVAAWDGWRANMYRLAVAEDRRRQGIARTLIAAGEESLRARGARRISAIVVDEHGYATATWRDAGYDRQDTVGRFVKLID
jgi:ribosomal protein S18 acetylase RimI-like enzyme